METSDFMLSIVIAQRTCLIWQFVQKKKKNGFIAKQFADNLTKLSGNIP